MYAVVYQPSVRNQELVLNESRISKKSFTIPRLELVSAHMASNLIENVEGALKRCNIRSITEWRDSTVVLHWLNRQTRTANRVSEILEKEYINLYYVLTKQNPANIGSRGTLLVRFQTCGGKVLRG